MQENSRYAVGLDVGTSTVRCVVGHVEGAQASPTIIGVGECPNGGMRKGTVVNLVNAASAIDKALELAERMSGYQIGGATISVNGSHIIGMSSRGVIAVGAGSHEINDDDLHRVEEAATVVQLPANREILEVTPRSYQLDGQENIKDPIGMTGVRLEVDAHVITGLSPHIKNLRKACEMTETTAHSVVLAGLAAARAVVTDQQTENGVILIDIGGATTNIAVYEEGDLQHVAVLPVGSVNITNDLAIGLKTDLDVAELVKLQHATAMPRERKERKDTVSVKTESGSHEFAIADIDMIVDARLEEIFELVNKELKSIGRAAKLPGGAVLTGGGSQLTEIADYARSALQLSARIGHAPEFAGVYDQVNSPAWSTALGLMLIDLEGSLVGAYGQNSSAKSGKSTMNLGAVTNKLTDIFSKFRS
ncbi:MAG: cell division protein FtsA [Candidatus Saccharimonadales bacterium]